VQIRLLGPLVIVADDGSALDVSGVRLRALLVRLAVDAPRLVSTATLIDALWGEEPPADAANALQSLVSRLRRALADPDAVRQAPGGYCLAVARDDVDLHRFDELARLGRSRLRGDDPKAAAATLRSAIALWRSPVAETWGEGVDATSYQSRLNDQRLDTVGDLFEAELELGQYAEVAAELDEIVVRYPLRERLAGLYLRALAASGRQSDALAHYERVRQQLADELGVDPSPELQSIHLAILRGEIEQPSFQPGSRRRSNLKAALTSFVGRDDEVARIAKLLDESRLVTLVGPGGAGKTRLASVAAGTLVDAMPDGVWLAELAPVTDPDDVASAVLDALDLRDATLLDRNSATASAATRDATKRLIEALAASQCLLLLDNCEHVIDAAARLVDDLLGQCPSLRVVTTTREPLGIVGETLVVVPPLAQPAPDASLADAVNHPAVRLFADRAEAVDPDFSIDNSNVGAVIEIVRRLDGLPLAIELAAARLRSLPVDEIATRLSDRFRLLTGGSRTAMSRHRTLRAVVEWSWDLLAERERLLVERLAVFAGSFAPEDAQEVCTDDSLPIDDIDDLLASLVEKSLLQKHFIDHRQRYRMLETLREFGIERLAEHDAVLSQRRRHAAHYAAFVRVASPHTRRREQLHWMARLEAERDNILAGLRFLCDDGQAQAALELACELSTYWTITGRHADSSGWLTTALAVPGRVDGLTRLGGESLQAVNSVASMASSSPEQIEADLQRLREIGRRLDAIELPSDSLILLLRPVIAMFGDEDQSTIAVHIAKGIASTDPWVAATTRLFSAGLAENNGDIATTRAEAKLALAQFRELGERWGLASALGILGQLKAMEGDVAGAANDLQEALEQVEQLADHDDAIILHLRLGYLRIFSGDLEGARDCVASMERRAEASSTRQMAVFTMILRGEIARAEGDLTAARNFADQGLAIVAAVPAVHPTQGHIAALANAFAGRLRVDEGDLSAARAQLADAYSYATGTRDMPILAGVGVCVAMLALAYERYADATEILGATAQVRGSEDVVNPDVVKLTARLRDELGTAAFESAYDVGRNLDSKAACARMDPATISDR